MTRIFHVAAHVWPNDERVERNVITQSPQSVVVGWVLLPGQTIEAHRHPAGQDTWVVLEGEAEYLMGDGETRTLRRGDIAVAAPGQCHGARNLGVEPFLFISVVAPAKAGYEAVEA
jgi:quercetin dioxygenase-like cupin family protein